MYKLLKNTAKKIIPQSLIQKNETWIRNVVTLMYKGSKFQCTICGVGLRKWVILDRGDLLCPNCGSLPRSRRLKTILSSMYLKDKHVLHFSPPTALRKFLNLSCGTYSTTDYESEFEADYRYDITDMEVGDDTFDVIICYHVLEHVIDDEKAMSELYRVVKEGGTVIVQTPFHDEPTMEDSTIDTPEKRLEIYGQRDHVRLYNADDLCLRLENVGFDVTKLVYNKDESNCYGYKEKDVVLIGTK